MPRTICIFGKITYGTYVINFYVRKIFLLYTYLFYTYIYLIYRGDRGEMEQGVKLNSRLL